MRVLAGSLRWVEDSRWKLPYMSGTSCVPIGVWQTLAHEKKRPTGSNESMVADHPTWLVWSRTGKVEELAMR